MMGLTDLVVVESLHKKWNHFIAFTDSFSQHQKGEKL